jgi:hypothetical protein
MRHGQAQPKTPSDPAEETRTMKTIFPYPSTLKEESTRSSRTMATIYETTRCYISDKAGFIVTALRILRLDYHCKYYSSTNL